MRFRRMIRNIWEQYEDHANFLYSRDKFLYLLYMFGSVLLMAGLMFPPVAIILIFVGIHGKVIEIPGCSMDLIIVGFTLMHISYTEARDWEI